MIVDTSAIVAILRQEEDFEQYARALDQNQGSTSMSAATYLETAIVIDAARSPIVSRLLDELIAEAQITIEPFTESQAKIARQAYADFGRGSNHPANLNFGDCFAYALAAEKRQPILYKGTDFQKTDLRSAL